MLAGFAELAEPEQDTGNTRFSPRAQEVREQENREQDGKREAVPGSRTHRGRRQRSLDPDVHRDDECFFSSFRRTPESRFAFSFKIACALPLESWRETPGLAVRSSAP